MEKNIIKRCIKACSETDMLGGRCECAHEVFVLNIENDVKERSKALDILLDHMSDNTVKHINKVSYLEDWIIDAMIEFKELKELDESEVCPNCEEECMPISIGGRMCNKCYYDKL